MTTDMPGNVTMKQQLRWQCTTRCPDDRNYPLNGALPPARPSSASALASISFHVSPAGSAKIATFFSQKKVENDEVTEREFVARAAEFSDGFPASTDGVPRLALFCVRDSADIRDFDLTWFLPAGSRVS